MMDTFDAVATGHVRKNRLHLFALSRG
jgi:hypothetical protein